MFLTLIEQPPYAAGLGKLTNGLCLIRISDRLGWRSHNFQEDSLKHLDRTDSPISLISGLMHRSTGPFLGITNLLTDGSHP